MTTPPPLPRCTRSGFLKVALIAFGILAAAVLGVGFMVDRALTGFDSRRDMMALRSGLEVRDEHLRYSPGIDGIMWCRFTVEAKGLDQVFDPSQVDVSKFNEQGFQIGRTPIGDRWWDVKGKKLTGGSVELRQDETLDVGYVDHGDGTLTVYLYWFEV